VKFKQFMNDERVNANTGRGPPTKGLWGGMTKESALTGTHRYGEEMARKKSFHRESDRKRRIEVNG